MTAPTGRQPLSADALPASGAWRPGDPVGARRFAVVAEDRPFALEGGGTLTTATLAYETWGTLDAEASNAVLVCHALTMDAHAARARGAGPADAGWWEDLIGPGQAIDTDRYFVVCANVLGGCQGSTGPSSLEPATGRPYGSRFPVVSVRDIVRAQSGLARVLGVRRWLSVVGGSMGGMQALEWAVMFPDRVASVVPIATTMAATAQQIAWSSVQRQAIALDPRWRGGDYYDAADGDGPHAGLALAREMAQITYRTDAVFTGRFGRGSIEGIDRFSPWQRFDVESYLDYHGAKLARRFDANSYMVVSKAMDLHDIGRNRGGVDAALARVKAPTLVMSIDSDALYLPEQQEAITAGLRRLGRPVEHVNITSPDGHDAFLLAADQVARALTPFLDEVHKTHA